MGISAGLSAYQLSYELSPVIFQNGIAANIPGGILPIISITEALNFVDGLLSGGNPLDFGNFFAHFRPMPGSKLSSQIIGHYPFANQAVAANAVIAQPIPVPMLMVCPWHGELGYLIKQATMSALQAAVKLHNASGGTYIVATPSFIYTNCLSLDITDVSNSEDKQAQHTYRWDFEAPLLTLQDAVNAQTGLMQQITNGVPSGTDYSGLPPSTGVPSQTVGAGVVGSSPGLAGSTTTLGPGGPT
jgi:hypothetical protein